MAKKTQIKQKQKQTVNINIGNRAVKRRRPRKAKSKGTYIFPTPIINYPPNYVNPAVVQPLQQPQVPLVPRPVPTPRGYAVYPESETALHVGLPFAPVPFVPQASASLVPVPPLPEVLGTAVIAPKKGYVRLTEEQKAANKAARQAGRQQVEAYFDSGQARRDAEERRREWLASLPPASADITFVGDEPEPPPLSGLERKR